MAGSLSAGRYDRSRVPDAGPDQASERMHYLSPPQYMFRSLVACCKTTYSSPHSHYPHTSTPPIELLLVPIQVESHHNGSQDRNRLCMRLTDHVSPQPRVILLLTLP